jgi:cobalt/nickel transport system ATP-binding protein
VLGRNGSGKSTLFALLNGLQRPQVGQVLCQGEAVRYDRLALKKLRAQVGLVFQEPDQQLFSASLREDVSFGPMNLGLDKKETANRVDKALADVGLAALADRPVHALSHGQKKRACIAGVLAMHPEIIILDEPTAGLDPAMVRELTSLLDDLHRRGLTLILATHDVDFAYAWADAICILDQGVLAFQGGMDEFANVLPRLPQLGLKSPWVLELHARLKTKGILGAKYSIPRSQEDLLGLLR